MPAELPLCVGEYRWSQAQPIDATVTAVLQLPQRCSLSVGCGRDHRRQSLTLVLTRSATGLGHLNLSELTHDGCAAEPAATGDLFQLLLNTTVTVLRHHCPLQVSLGGVVPEALLSGAERLPLPWQHWGFQLLASPTPGCRRVLARVRNLRTAAPAARANQFPLALSREALRWTGA